MVSDTYKLESNGQVKLSIYQATGLYPNRKRFEQKLNETQR